MEVFAFERTLTELDHVRLARLVHRGKSGGAPSTPAAAIADLLDGADVVPSRQVSPDVVTMYSRVLLRDIATDQLSTLTVTYPADADPGAGFVSVLSPVGWSLLGLRVGAVARWMAPTGEERGAEIVALPFQPESSGDYTV